MKSHATDPDREAASRAAASRQKGAEPEAAGLSAEGQTFQRKQRTMIDTSPYMSAQRKRLGSLNPQPAQRQMPEEEDLMQGKIVAQRQDPEEEEELLQGKFAAQRLVPEEEEELQMKSGESAIQQAVPEEEELMQGKFAAETKAQLNGTANQPPLQRSKSTEENRTGIPDELKTWMENSLGADFSDVTVHADSGKARDVGALAYTQGADVHFAPGQFKPETSDGKQLLSHELTHVVQQRQGKVSPTTEVAGMPVNDDPALEKEADEKGKKV